MVRLELSLQPGEARATNCLAAVERSASLALGSTLQLRSLEAANTALAVWMTIRPGFGFEWRQLTGYRLRNDGHFSVVLEFEIFWAREE